MSETQKSTLTKEQLGIGQDLQKKCAHDVVTTMMRSIVLSDNLAAGLYISCGGAIAAHGIVMRLMADENAFGAMSGAQMHENSLFAAIFAWMTDSREHKGPISQMMPKAVVAWEYITGKTFDPSWMIPPLQDAAKGGE